MRISTSGINVIVYPKPIEVVLPSSIPFAQYTVIDLTGRIAIDSRIYNQKPFETKSLPACDYIYPLLNYSRKFLAE